MPPEITHDEFHQACIHNGIPALLHHLMHERPEWLGWPEDIRQSLDELNKANVAQELFRAHHLAKVLDAFSSRNIRCLVLKGEALARTHYATPSLRSRVDCDLFVDVRDIPVAVQAVCDLGLSIVSAVYKSHQFTVRRASSGLDIIEFDVHSRVLNSPLYARVLSFDEAYNDSVSASGLVAARVLHPIDALLHSCLHRVANKNHDRNRLIWIYDIHILASHMKPEQMGEFAAKALMKKVQSACLDGLSEAQIRFHTDIPTDILLELAKPASKSMGTWTRHFAESNLSLLIDDLRVLPDMHSKWSLIRELFFPSSASLMQRYGKNSRLWLPLLYLQQVLGGIVKRLSLR